MNVQILETLLQLFAILAKEDGVTQKDELIVRNFLHHQFNDVACGEFVEPESVRIDRLCGNSFPLRTVGHCCRTFAKSAPAIGTRPW